MAGFGASGRNGGWCSALFATSDAALARRHGLDAMRAMRRAMQETGRRRRRHRGGRGHRLPLRQGWVGRPGAQRGPAGAGHGRGRRGARARLRRGRPALARARRDAAADRRRRTRSARRSHRTAPRCSRRSWPGAWPTRSSGTGCSVYEHTEVLAIRPGAAGGRPGGRHRAAAPCEPTSWCGPRRPGRRPCPGCQRAIVPVYSLMVATEPLGADFWASAGLESRATFADHRHMIIYGQRTADGRIAFGGGGRPTTSARPSAPPSTPSRRCTRCCARR